MGAFSDLFQRAQEAIPKIQADRAAEQARQEEESRKFKENNYTSGVNINPRTETERDSDTRSLRRGEGIEVYKSIDPSKGVDSFFGGISGMRYLGRGEADVYNPEYFSSNEISEKYAPLKISIEDDTDGKTYKTLHGAKPVGDITVYYDDDGAIAGVTTDSDVYFKNGKKYKKGTTIYGKEMLSDFFKDFGTAADDTSYILSGGHIGGTPTTVWAGGSSGARKNDIGYHSPTNLFGLNGMFSANRNKATRTYQRDVWDNTYGITGGGDGEKAWEKYWNDISNGIDVRK